MLTNPFDAADPAEARKARGAFFTPDGITAHLAEWALRDPSDSVLEPSAGEAAFLIAAVERLRALGATDPLVHGIELHRASAHIARDLVQRAGGTARIRVSDFFRTEAAPQYDAVIGNPPFIRYQDWTGDQRDRARFAALQQGVSLTGLASSWAAFVIHAAAYLKPGGRLGMVLPAELLSVNYAAPVRRFLLERFATVELVTFEEQVFPDAEADTVLVKAEGWNGLPAAQATLRQTRNADTLSELHEGTTWTPLNTGDRWHPQPLRPTSIDTIAHLIGDNTFVPLSDHGDTTLGAVTGGNRFFALSPERVRTLGIPRRDLVRISPPGSSHLRGLALTDSAMARLGSEGHSTWLLYPSDRPADATLEYISKGVDTAVDQAYKCRVRSPWWRVPLLKPADLLLTYMNADTPRLTTNAAGVRHLNSVHGVYLNENVQNLARDVLPVASLNSVTLLGAELAGRSYGGGILKIEPREADRWWMPSADLLAQHRSELVAIKPSVQRHLQTKNLLAAVALVDTVLLDERLTAAQLDSVRADHADWMKRRMVRGKSG
ncbi:MULTISPECIES: HsdM family class I SAM-dependent methyltransferase [unclassified Rathayibacter]|uniref:HsdM family class I SAM-dependent methyltransferase n=1 Tax=unclassified Rathayibacter TaxID=2609250 RepID=UPI0006F21289|nr:MULTISPECIES: N-6 DNA methylase [unclassified Rathayibacter]KQP96139.1 methyltransferase [Rathayibacter sp. Leaf294]KQS08565.1 methyltransferase [Rathayibacter sp. Leaf185]